MNRKERVDRILEVLSEYTKKDFSHTLPVSENGDELDIISAGLNAMAGKMQEYVAERIENESQLQKSNALFSRLFEHNPSAIAISRISDSVMINVNAAFLRLFGFSGKEQVLHRKAADLNVWVDLKQREEMLHQLKEKGIVENLEGQMKTQQGEIKWGATSILITEVNNEACLIAVTLDITSRKKAEEQTQSINKELEAFTYSVSHDLRAPLRAVDGYAQMLKEEYGAVLDEEGNRIIKNIRNNATKMSMLIDDLLAFSHLGRKELNKKEVNMDQLTSSVLFDISKSITHEAKIKVNPLHPVFADYALLYQVMFNLISNAIKYSSKKDNPLVEILSEEKNGDIVFSVRDNGAGFDMQYVDKLFGVFHRLHSQEEFSGTGIGLAIVQRVIDKHRGKVWGEGKVNEGAVFNFLLPKLTT
jgi:PAS domain S-box-containing protein